MKAGRRQDLKGVAAALGPVVRLALLAGGALAAYGALRAAPWLLWPLTAAWCWRAWKTAEPAALEEPAPAGPAHDPDATRQAVLDWIREAIGDRQGVHLRDLLANAQQHGLFDGLDVAGLRAALEQHEVPVRKRVRVRGRGVTVGVHRDDLPAPAGAASVASPAAPSQEQPEPRLHVA